MAWQSGDSDALSKLTPLVYQELRRVAAHYMSGERSNHTLQPTALINQAFEHLLDADIAWQDRSHFIAVAATQMRRVLVDHAKSRLALKRGSGAHHESLTTAELAQEDVNIDLLALDTALDNLSNLDKSLSQTVELHYFAGLTQREIASVTALSKTQVQRDLSFARSWLLKELAQ